MSNRVNLYKVFGLPLPWEETTRAWVHKNRYGQEARDELKRLEPQRRALAAACKRAGLSIAFERFERGRHAVVAVRGDVQVGWCIRRDGGWWIEDMDCKTFAEPFCTLAAAASAGKQVFAHLAGRAIQAGDGSAPEREVTARRREGQPTTGGHQ